ncbi:MAG TPA: response regulator, partial [Polyangiaceae bacterium LLY-WYZ-15_(1-7)]|nr:response regulator [Polyangiaceae bacterium LLY-WYZ-15_(1-7)]HJL44197.1 response regulator [Polyangiaceae bacterium LLY-WYZ-15_(1-7)]
MAHRILVFEADTQFASELRNGFAGRDVELEIVSEGKKGLEQAAATPPDLILLSIELPSMNGFLVCKKIKKNGDLSSIPLLILSSDPNADEIFEQHKKLRTRAEDYVKKPVAFDALLGRIREFLPIADPAEEPNSSTMVIDQASVDDEIDAFADSAFDALMMGEEGGQAAPPPEAAPASDVVEDLEIEELEFEEDEPTAVVSAEALEAAALDDAAPAPRRGSGAPPPPESEAPKSETT